MKTSLFANRRTFCKSGFLRGSLLCILIFFCSFLSQSAFALTSDAVLMNKTLANGLRKCYSSSYMKDGSNTDITANNTSSIDSLLVGTLNIYPDVVNIPSKVGNGRSLVNDDITCKELFTGFGWVNHVDGLLGSASSYVKGKELLEKLGYKKTSNGDDGICIWYTYDYKNGSGTAEGRTNKICFKVQDKKVVKIDSATSSSDKSGPIVIDSRLVNISGKYDIWARNNVDDTISTTLFEFYENVDVSAFETSARNGANNLGEKITVNGANVTPYYQSDSSGDGEKTWKIFSWDSAALEALRNLTSYNDWNEAAFTNQEKYDLYIGYLLGNSSVYELYALPKTCKSNVSEASERSIPFQGSGSVLWCDLGGDFSSSKKVNAFFASSADYLDSSVGVDGIITAIRGMNLDGVTLVSINTETGSVGSTISNGDSNTCKTSSGALGWIVCPVITWVGKTLNTVYEEMVEPFLKIEPDLVSTNGATFQAWEVFRNIANVVFVILFLFVIFSQVTGIGIDNYGIKKILPKLIVSAILINLSYIICQLAVDLSNIVGSGVNIMLSEIANNIPIVGFSGGANSGLWFKHVLNSLLGVIGAGEIAGVALAISSVGVLSALILPLLFGLITALISVVCFFGLLGLRQACVIALVAIAPLAFVCYMLPNTKRIFDKWLKLLEAMLLLYPICGLVIGGSALASRILIGNSTNFFVYLIGLVITVVPFFFIPMLLRNAFSTLGNIGARVMNAGGRFGRNVSTRADRDIRNTDMYKNAQERRAENRVRFRAGVDRNGNEIELGRFGRFVRGGERNVARARAQYLKNLEMRSREENMMGTGFESAMAGVETKAGSQMVSDYESLISNGKAQLEGDAGVVNVNDMESVGTYHAEALARYNNATTDAEKTKAMAEIKAAQNILSRTDKGRTRVETNLSTMLARTDLTENGKKGLSEAASHLLGNYGDKYKAVNRGAHTMITDLATTNLSDGAKLGALQGKLAGNVYRFAGTDKYTAEALANADESVLNNFVNGVRSGALVGPELDNIQATAYSALQNAKIGNLNIKPEVSEKLKTIAGDYGARHPDQASQDRQRQKDMARDLSEINRRLRGGPGRGRRGGGPAP